MNLKNRLTRFTVALALAGTISAQIPASSGTAMAQDDYPGSGGGGGTVRGLIQATVFLLVGYGVYGTLTDKRGGVPPVDPGAGGAPPVIGAENNKPIWDVLDGNEDWKTLASQTDKAGLKDTLRSEGPYTMFAPTTAAFGALPADTLSDLEKPENADKMKGLLSFHVIKGKYTIEELKALTMNKPEGVQLETIVPGQSVTITNDGGLKINGVAIIETDIPASNGVIHPLGTVMTPPAP
jgi:uncharacterized surface protein with fasciclin (FAS1) repeats